MVFHQASTACHSTAIALHWWYAEGQALYLILSKLSQKRAPDKQKQALRLVSAILKNYERLNKFLYGQLLAFNETLRFWVYFLFEKLKFLICNFTFYP